MRVCVAHEKSFRISKGNAGSVETLLIENTTLIKHKRETNAGLLVAHYLLPLLNVRAACLPSIFVLFLNHPCSPQQMRTGNSDKQHNHW